jgi:hypothetical protein
MGGEKKMPRYIILAGFILMLASLAGAGDATVNRNSQPVTEDVDVTAVYMKRDVDKTVVQIETSGEFEYEYTMLPSSQAKPYRLLIDIQPAVFRLDGRHFSDLPSYKVDVIRASQYTAEPDKIVRIVLDLSGEVEYAVQKNGHYINIYINDKESPAFEIWSSMIPSDAPERRHAVPVKVKKSPPPPEPKNYDEAEDETELAQVYSAEEPGAPEPSLPSQPEPSPAPVYWTGVDYVVPEVPLVLVETEPEPEVIIPDYSEFITEEAAEPAARQDEEAYYNDDQVVGEAGGYSEETPEPEYAEEMIAPPAVDEIVEAAGSPVTPPQVAYNSPEKCLPIDKEKMQAQSPRQAQPVPVPPTDVVIAPSNPPETVTSEFVDSLASATDAAGSFNDSLAMTEESSGEGIDSPESNVPRPTSRFRKKPAFPTKLKGTIVAEFPQRMVIRYGADNRRDPFKTLIDTKSKHEGPTMIRIPDVETSRLVGVLKNTAGERRALLEDLDGYGYIVKTGDKIKKGYVEKIESDKAYFRLFEYGWSRVVALYLGHN